MTAFFIPKVVDVAIRFRPHLCAESKFSRPDLDITITPKLVFAVNSNSPSQADLPNSALTSSLEPFMSLEVVSRNGPNTVE